MSSGKNHDRSIYFASPVVLVVGSCYFGWQAGIVAASSHLLGGLLLSPDLDLISRPYKRWGLLRFIWVPYQKLIPRHRHWLSHGVIVGSVVRLFYLSVWFSPLWFVFPSLSRINWVGVTAANAMVAKRTAFGIAFFAGVELSALNHLLLDGFDKLTINGLIVPLPQSIKSALKGS